jgi:hypothetical protein
LAALVVTLAATAVSYLLPEAHAATGVGAVFMAAVYWLVLRREDSAGVRGFGLSLGGLLELEPIVWRRAVRHAVEATGAALLAALVVFPGFWVGFKTWWNVSVFRPAPLLPVLEDMLGQLLVIGLPEEAFYRGYLQTELDRRFGTPWRVWGASLGLGLLLTSAIFALGHLLTRIDVNRLAVFFPSLLFGFLRAKTGGIGAPIVFHALCNVFAAYLLRSYGLSR